MWPTEANENTRVARGTLSAITVGSSNLCTGPKFRAAAPNIVADQNFNVVLDLITDAVQRASLLGKEFRSAFTHEDTSHIPSLGPRTSSTITPIHVEVAGVQKLLNRLKPNKACGPDKIPNRVLKEMAPVLAPPLTALYNKSLEEGTVPAEWRHALVTPVYRKGDKHSPSNYRPISLTVVCCKLLEHIVCNHVLTHLEENNLLTTLQHGFRRGHSCDTQLLLTYDDLIRSFDKTLQTDMAILDFSRAFDTVPHRRLISKLTSYGVKGQVLTWIDSFLSDRKMTVVVDGHTAKESIRVLSGVPQGTVLGPLLFLVYINDIVSTGTTIRLFADDCLVYRPLRKNNEDQQRYLMPEGINARVSRYYICWHSITIVCYTYVQQLEICN